MANHKKSPGYKGCRLCKPHKSMGNSVQAIKAKYREVKMTKEIFDCD